MAAVATMEGKNNLGPIYAPRMVREWKRKTDGAWLTKTNLVKYWTKLTGVVDVARCSEFLASMATRSKEESYSSGFVEEILVQYSCRYLYIYFDWDDTDSTEWTAECATPRPDVNVAVKGLQSKEDRRYDVFALGHIMGEPWFA